MPLPKLLGRALPVLCLLTLATPVFSAVNPGTLTIGDPAPPLKVRWIKGSPIEKFENGRVYLVEFWATWCGPCKVVMPHLSELARKYAGKVDVIGVDILEKGGKDQPYEAFYPRIRKFVDEMGDRMAYNVAMDTNGQPMAATWLDAAGQTGIPCSFLVKEGKVAWIGHPGELDKVLDAILDGSFKTEEFAKKFKEAGIQEKEQRTRRANFYERMKPLTELIVSKRYADALTFAEAELPLADAEFKPFLEEVQLRMCIQVDESRFLAMAEERLKGKTFDSAFWIGEIIVSANTASPKLNNLAIACYNRLLTNPPQTAVKVTGVFAFFHSQIALCHARCQDLPKAIEAQERAIALARQAISEEPTDAIKAALTGYESALQDYRKKLQDAK